MPLPFLVGIAIGVGVLFSGLCITGYMLEKFEDAKKQGVREGYDNATKECGEKLKRQKEAHERAEEEINSRFESERKTSAEAQKAKEEWLKEAFKLYGEHQGYIRAMREKGYSDASPELKDAIENLAELETLVSKTRERSENNLATGGYLQKPKLFLNGLISFIK